MGILDDDDLPFTFALTHIWNSLDDFFLCIGIVLLSVPLIVAIGSTVQHYFRYSRWMGQMITFGLLTGVFLYLLGYVAGQTTSVSLLQGFALGVGYALQPYIVSLLSGATYFSTGMLKANDLILIEEKEYKVISNGIFYIEASRVTENIILYIPNHFFNNSYLKKTIDSLEET